MPPEEIAGPAWIRATLQIPVHAQQTGPSLVDTNLAVRAVTTNLTQPTSMAFIGANDILVLEKASGKVQRVVDGTITSTVLDLPVNSASERGLLGIALHPDFPTNPGVYLYWTETLSNADSTVFADTPLLGNRVDRFHWDGATWSNVGSPRHSAVLRPGLPVGLGAIAATPDTGPVLVVGVTLDEYRC